MHEISTRHTKFSGQKGYIGLFLTVFLAVSAIVFLGISKLEIPVFPQQQVDLTQITGGCIPYTGLNPPTVEALGPLTMLHAGTKEATEDDQEENDPTVDALQNVDYKTKQALKRSALDVTQKATYQLVISNVAVFTHYLNNNIKKGDPNGDGRGIISYFGPSAVREVNGKKYYVMYPARHGEVHPGGNSNAEGINRLRLREYGLLFLAHMNVDGSPVVIGKSGNTYIVTDVYQEVNLAKSKPLPPGMIELCQGKGTGKDGSTVIKATVEPEKKTIIFPSQSISKDQKQLQLQYFLFEGGQAENINGVWTVHCKPAIYLYPEQETTVVVRVDTKGYLTYVDPAYSATGWKVLAEPSGRLFVDNMMYPYLYYESKIPDNLIEKPEKGYVVTYDQLPMLYTSLLPKLGLNTQQTVDFIAYWQNALPNSPYYFVGILDEKNINSFEPLTIVPRPETIIRVRLYFEALTAWKEVVKPQIRTPEKDGFTVVEWGGMVKTDKSHTFTCSQ